MNRRTFPKSAAAASVATLLRPSWADAALPQAKITRIRFCEAPNVMPLQIPLLQSNMVVTIETDANITGIGEGGTRDTLEPCAGRLIGKNPFHIERLWQDMYRAFHYPQGENASTPSAHWTSRCGTSKAKPSAYPCTTVVGIELAVLEGQELVQIRDRVSASR
jgi:hypothetical protein